jgi:hypothetical protein
MSEKKLEVTYVWKQLTTDGLLKEPEPAGYSYDEVHINALKMTSEVAAVERLQEYIDLGGAADDFVLVKLFNSWPLF